jgi:hypothetical protein
MQCDNRSVEAIVPRERGNGANQPRNRRGGQQQQWQEPSMADLYRDIEVLALSQSKTTPSKQQKQRMEERSVEVAPERTVSSPSAGARPAAGSRGPPAQVGAGRGGARHADPARGQAAARGHADAAAPAADAASDAKNDTRGNEGGGARKARQPRGGRGGRGKTDDDYGSGGSGGLTYPVGEGMSRLPVPRVNTETMRPSHKPADMRMVVDVANARRSVNLTVRDVYYAPCVFNRPGDADLYTKLVHEIQHCHVPEATLLKSWHGDSHWIADDSTGWKRDCPTFSAVVKRLQEFLGMTVNATRFNWYTDTSEWKPFHHDAAAVKPHMAKTQNFTAGVSFGATRDAAFEDAQRKVVVSMPQPNGSIYCFSRDTNILWRHGILQETTVRPEGRISIIAWGWVDQTEVD